MWTTPLLPVLYTSVHIRSQTPMVIRYGVIISIGFCVMCTVHAYCTCCAVALRSQIIGVLLLSVYPPT